MDDSKKELNRGDLILLSIKAAISLWGVDPTLRAINIGWCDCSIDINFIYNGFILDDARELSECIATEVFADFPDEAAFRTHHKRCDFPNPIPQFGLEAYHRDEKDYENMPKKPDSIKKNIQGSIQHALTLYDISPSVRSINFRWDECEHSINIYFVYDKDISDDAAEISELVATQVLADFFEVKEFRTHHIQCDFPNPIPQFGQEAYRRKEQNDENQTSHLTYPDPEALLKKYAGTGKTYGPDEPEDIGFMEVIECDEIIGEWFEKGTKKFFPTKRATIHYDREGNAFIIPSNPKPFVEAFSLMKIFFYFTKKIFRKRDLLRLSIKSGLELWGVSHNLKEVRIGCNKTSIDIYFIYDSFPFFDAVLISESAVTEVQADFSFEPIRTHHYCNDIPNTGEKIVYRKEGQWKESK